MRNIKLPITFFESDSRASSKKQRQKQNQDSSCSSSTHPRYHQHQQQQQQQQRRQPESYLQQQQFVDDDNNNDAATTNTTSTDSTRSLASSVASSVPYTDSILSHYDGTHLEIAAIESTLMVQDYDMKKKKRVRRVLTVFNIIIEDRHYHRSLVRYVSDFVEFDRKVKKYYRKSKISLPPLIEPDIHLYGTGKRASIRAFLLRFARRQYEKPNSEKIEVYLRQCALDPTVGRSSLFRDFIMRQRPEDKAAPKEFADNYHHVVDYQQQEQQQQQHAESSYPRQQPIASIATSSSSGDSKSSAMSIIEEPAGIHNGHYSNNIPSSSTAPAAVDEGASSPIASLSMEESPLPTSSLSRYISSTEDESIQPAPTIQDYQFLKVLGKGCMGKVLLVRSYRSPTRLLALKAISKENVINQREIEHTKMERDILTTLAQIRHPFLIRLHHAFQSADQLFLVLDYHRGGDMATQLAKFHTFSPERCRLYAAEILLGLQELHSLGILYRDLKPENILLAADGHIVLTDFGLSRQFPSAENMDDKRTRTFCGTAEYLAPEILRSEPYTYAVDFWSLGTILYEMVEGTPPFYETAHAEMYRRIMEDDLEFTPAFDPITRDFIKGLLRKPSSQRLGTGPNGPTLIRSHPYFAGLDWSDVYHKRIRPEYVPQLRSETDLSNFDRDFLVMTPRLSPVSNPDIYSDAVQEVFQGYSYINDSSNFTYSLISGDDNDEDDDDDIIRLDGDRRRSVGIYSDDYSGSDIRPDDFHPGSRDDEGFSTVTPPHHHPYPQTLF